MYRQIKISFLLISILLLSQSVLAQYGNKLFGLSVSYVYTTESKLFLSPNAVDPILRNISTPFDGMNSYSAELRYRLSDPIIIGIGAETIEKTEFTRDVRITGGAPLEVEDGYKLIPIELTGYYLLPFSTESFKFYMGGGAGIYIGSHIRKVGDVESTTESREFAYGIHVGLGMDYLYEEFISVRGEMKFRDPEFETTNKYTKEAVTVNGESFLITNPTFDSKVNINGISFIIGLVLHF